jgi:hypothetical protein
MTLAIDPLEFCVSEGKRVDRKRWPTHAAMQRE